MTEERSNVQRELFDKIEAAEAANMTTCQRKQAEIADLKAEIARLCRAGDKESARRMTDVAVSIARTGEPAKE